MIECDTQMKCKPVLNSPFLHTFSNARLMHGRRALYDPVKLLGIEQLFNWSIPISHIYIDNPALKGYLNGQDQFPYFGEHIQQ